MIRPASKDYLRARLTSSGVAFRCGLPSASMRRSCRAATLADGNARDSFTLSVTYFSPTRRRRSRRYRSGKTLLVRSANAGRFSRSSASVEMQDGSSDRLAEALQDRQPRRGLRDKHHPLIREESLLDVRRSVILQRGCRGLADTKKAHGPARPGPLLLGLDQRRKRQHEAGFRVFRGHAAHLIHHIACIVLALIAIGDPPGDPGDDDACGYAHNPAARRVFVEALVAPSPESRWKWISSNRLLAFSWEKRSVSAVDRSSSFSELNPLTAI